MSTGSPKPRPSPPSPWGSTASQPTSQASPPVRVRNDRALAAFADGQVDRPCGAWRQRGSDDLAAVAGDGHGSVPAGRARCSAAKASVSSSDPTVSMLICRATVDSRRSPGPPGPCAVVFMRRELQYPHVGQPVGYLQGDIRASAEAVAVKAWAILHSRAPLILSSATWPATRVAIPLPKSRRSVRRAASNMDCASAGSSFWRSTQPSLLRARLPRDGRRWPGSAPARPGTRRWPVRVVATRCRQARDWRVRALPRTCLRPLERSRVPPRGTRWLSRKTVGSSRQGRVCRGTTGATRPRRNR